LNPLVGELDHELQQNRSRVPIIAVRMRPLAVYSIYPVSDYSRSSWGYAPRRDRRRCSLWIDPTVPFMVSHLSNFEKASPGNSIGLVIN